MIRIEKCEQLFMQKKKDKGTVKITKPGGMAVSIVPEYPI